mgnify:FL=1
MGFCSYSREFSLSSFTGIENQFINKYMPIADGDAVKAYLFGLYLCQNVQGEYTLAEAARTLNMTEEKLIDLFRFWEDFDLLEILSVDPFAVRYLPADYSKGKPKRMRAEKYADFNKAVQSLMPRRMISSNEFMKYFSVMEEYSLKPDAMLLIVRYCIDLKGDGISQNYILQTAKNFAGEGVTTVEQIEKKLSDYVIHSSDIAAVLRAMGSTKKPEPDDYKLLKKWTDDLGFELSAILYTASLHKRGGMEKLDSVLEDLYANKKFTEPEIKDHLARKSAIRTLTIQIAKELGVYCAVVDTYVDNFVSGWLAAGYDDASLINLAKYCFRREKKSFEKMDELLKKLAERGVISADSIVGYMENEAHEQEFAAEVLRTAGVSRKVNNWDRDNLRNWRSWSFSDEMILKAAEQAAGKISPIPYINSVLSSWKSKGIFSPEQIATAPVPGAVQAAEEKNEDFRKKVRNYYFNLRERAKDRADYYLKHARADDGFSSNEESIRATEIELAKAEALGGDVKALSDKLSALRSERAEILHRLKLTEEMLVPQYRCKRCGDTGFDKNGNVCSCYKKFVENASDEKKLENILEVYSNIEM